MHGKTEFFLPKILIMQKLAQALDIPEKILLTAPPDDFWTLEIKINNKEMIDMTQCGCISNLDLQKNYAALTLGGSMRCLKMTVNLRILLISISMASYFRPVHSQICQTSLSF